MNRFVILLFTIISVHLCTAQTRTQLLDSLLKADEPLRGKFALYIRPAAFEIMTGLYRSRTQITTPFSPFAASYQVYLPFQFELGYLHFSEKEKLIKLNTLVVFHHTNHLNYAMGLGERLSFLLTHKTYLSYQGGIVWCEVMNRKVNDGITMMGFSLHHVMTLSYQLTQPFNLSLNFCHLSSGRLFQSIDNNQDYIAVGIKYTWLEKRQ